MNHENILVILCLDSNNKFLVFENIEEKHDKYDNARYYQTSFLFRMSKLVVFDDPERL